MVTKKRSLLLCVMILAGITCSAQKLPGRGTNLASTPPMGWSSWNTFKKNPTEKVIRQIADAMVTTGLKRAGYLYVNIDDFWSPGRDDKGHIIIDSTKFPHGMKVVADYIHSKGLKAGIYTNIGAKANYPTLASGGYYQEDMATFASWGFDYVKVDVNFAPDRSEDAYTKEFTAVARAVQSAPRSMFLNVCNQGGGNYQHWAPGLANSWRVGADIDHSPKGARSQWEGVLYELNRSAAYPDIAGPGHWNDADMMLVGVGSDSGRLTVMTYEEQKSHFSMWCMIASPLILGNDLRNISRETLSILTNREAISINQDQLGIQGRMLVEQAAGLQVWVKKLYSKSGQKYAVALFNTSGDAGDMTLEFKKAGLPANLRIRNVWTHKDLGSFTDKYTKNVPSHGVEMLIISD